MLSRSVKAVCLQFLIGLLLPYSIFAQVPPERALSTFQTAPGLELQLFASEPMFSNPTCMDIDERGRVWVCESVNYRTTLHRKPRNRAEGDRIVILQDTKGVGKADKATTFYQAPDFLAPLGIAVSKDPVGPGYKVYVCHSPHIYVFEDKDGDGKADGPPKILLTGFNGIDHDHGVHGIHFGPDGKLYFSVGDQGVRNLKDKNGKIWNTNQTDCKAGTIWRCNTDGTGLELLAHNFRNQYEPAVNSFGTMFVSDNDDDGSMQTRICHVMYGGDYGYWPRNRGDHHWHEDQPGVVHKTLRTGFGSPTGLCWYEGKLLQPAFSRLLAPPLTKGRSGGVEAAAGGASTPQNLPQPLLGKEGSQPYEGYLLHTDAGPREVRLFGVRPKGAGYELDKVNLVTSADTWFRPSDVCVASDGSVFIADWYDPGVGGHGMGDTTRGRIYRLTAKGENGYSIPPVDISNTKGKLDALLSPCITTRQISIELTPKNDFEKVRPLVEELGFNHAPVLSKLRLFWAIAPAYIDAIQKKGDDIPVAAGMGMMPPVRDELVQMTPSLMRIDEVFENHKLQKWMRKESDKTSSFIDDLCTDDPARREMLVSIRGLDPAIAKPFFDHLSKKFNGKDRTYLSALNIACGTDQKRREAILADFEKHFPDWNDKTAWLVWELRPPKVIAKLGTKLANEVMSPLQTELALGALAASSGTDGGESLLKLLQDTKSSRQVRAAALKTLLQYLPGKWSSLKDTILVRKAVEAQMTDGELLPVVVDLVAICERKDFQGFLERLAYNSEGHSNLVRFAAIKGLGKLKTKESVSSLIKILMLPEKPETRQVVISTLGKIGSTEALAPLQSYLLNDKLDPADRRMALEGLASSRAGTNWLLEQHAARQLPDAMTAETGRLLRSSPYQDLRNKANIAFPIARKMDLSKLPSPSELARKVGDAERGKTLVLNHKDLGCAKCHGFQGIGGHIGPDLSMIGIKASKENLFESILTPDKAIADQFVQHVVETKNGVVMTGLVVEETSDYLILRDANGKDLKIPLSEIDKRSKSAKSIMPDNLASFLTEEELVDVVAYLSTMKSPALSIDRWQVAGPFANDAQDSGLEKDHGPEKGFDAKARYTGKKGQVSWQTAVVNSAGYLDLAALHDDEAPMSVSYVYAEIEVTKAGWGEVKLGTDDGVNVLFNGRLVFRHRRHEAAKPGRDSIAVELKEGKNTLLLVVSNGTNPHGVYCTVLLPGTEPGKLITPK